MDPETGVFLVDSFRFRLIDAHDYVLRRTLQVDLSPARVVDLLRDVCVEIVEPPPQGRAVRRGAEVGAALSTKLRPPFAALWSAKGAADAFTAPDRRTVGAGPWCCRAFACAAERSPVARNHE